MIFQETYDLVLSRRKTQTRRVLKPGQRSVKNLAIKSVRGVTTYADALISDYVDGATLLAYVGQVRTVQPGRGKAGTRKIRITGLREEDLWCISQSDIVAEGVTLPALTGITASTIEDYKTEKIYEMMRAFWDLWDKIHGKTSYRAENNPRVVVYTFELIDEVNK